MSTKFYKISFKGIGNDANIVELNSYTETARAFIVKDNVLNHHIWKSDLPIKWLYSEALITSDLEAGKQEWNREMALRAEEAEQQAKRYRDCLINDEVNIEEEVHVYLTNYGDVAYASRLNQIGFLNWYRDSINSNAKYQAFIEINPDTIIPCLCSRSGEELYNKTYRELIPKNFTEDVVLILSFHGAIYL